MGLQDLSSKIKISYRTGRDNLVQDFYNPCLKECSLYRRAVGYFTSAGLSTAAAGVASLVIRKGKMRLVASPHLEEQDIDALNRAKTDPVDVLKRIIYRSFDDVRDCIERERLNALAWLIADGSLEVRLAIRTHPGGSAACGLYHEKIGIFSDNKTAHVAFSGSANETAGGLITNFESIKVFWSWDDPQNRVAEEIKNFDALWSNQTEGLSVIPFTEASEDLLQKYKATRPSKPEGESEPSEKKHSHAGAELRDYQKEALEKWKAAGGKGILSMATGTGKTKTALHIVQKMKETIHPFVVIVVCPYKNLANQWLKEMRELGLGPIACFESQQQWLQPLSESLSALRVGAKKFLSIVVTNRTFLSDEFQVRIDPSAFKYLLIADEVHNLGSIGLASKLNPQIQFRLGLSATPERHRDPDGTAAIYRYFRDIVFTFSIKEAIERGYLCRYMYFPTFVDLSDEESLEYWRLSDQIARAWPSNDEDEPDNRLKMLLIKRGRLLANAENKLPELKKLILAQPNPVKQALVYCGDGQVDSPDDEETNRYVDAACLLLGRDCSLRVRRFTCDESMEEREAILNQLRNGSLDAAVAIRCLDEGIDIPDVRMAFLLASSTNPRQFIQRRGRILRKAEGKSLAYIYDFIVVPPDFSGGYDDGAFNLERKLFQRELGRIVEFCQTAENGPVAIGQLTHLLKKYNLLSLTTESK
jgi:DNA phosphorothioation system restriction enzyme